LTLYGLHGLRLRSELPLAGFQIESGPADVEITCGSRRPVPSGAPPGRTVAARRRHGGYWYVACETAGVVTLRVPDICDFVVGADLATVECHLAPETDPAFVGLLVSGLVIALLLGLRGEVALHASAVEVDGVAIALAGNSGAGKSTLAAVLCAAGATLVTDDLLRIGTGPGGSAVSIGGSPQLRLRRHGAWAMDAFAAAPPVSTTIDDRMAIELPASVERTRPLAAVAFVRASRTAAAVQVDEMSGADALVRLSGVTRVGGWCDPAVLRRQFKVLAGLAGSLRVVEATVPWGPPVSAGVVPALLALAAAR
jgi:hypothetical protein